MPATTACYAAGGTIHTARACKVVTDAAGFTYVLEAAAGERALYISQDGCRNAPGLPGTDETIAANAKDNIQLFGPGEECLYTAGGAVTGGQRLKVGTGGKLVAAGGEAAGSVVNIVGIARSDAALDELTRMLIEPEVMYLP